MSIGKINDSTMQLAMLQMMQTIGNTVNNTVAQANAAEGNPLGVSADFSKPSELISKIAQLQESDPDKFKDLMLDIAGGLQKAAEDADGNGTDESSFYAILAAKFENVAETGDLAQLQPSGDVAKTGASGRSAGGGGVAKTSSTCVVCGAAIPEGATVCPKCGMPVQDAQQMQMMNMGKNEMDSIIMNIISKVNDDNGKPLGDITGLSQGEVMDKIGELKNSDPDKFKTLMSGIAEALDEQAGSAGSTASANQSTFESMMLAELSDKFESAAETGDLSILQPLPPPPPPPPPPPEMSMNAGVNTGYTQAAISQYLSDASTGSSQSLLDMFIPQADDSGSDPMSIVRAILIKALEAAEASQSTNATNTAEV